MPIALPLALLWVLLVLFVAAIVAFRIRNNGVVDIAWGIAIGGATLVAYFASPHATLRMALMTTLVLIWATRLSVRIYLRNRGRAEDSRYAAWRVAWGRSFFWRSILQIYVLQGVIACVVLLPALIVNSAGGPALGGVGILALSLWGIGFFFEARADYELDRFTSNPTNRGQLYTSGLFAYSRHPNYFGEALMWFALALLALPIEPFGLLAFLSPILLTFLLLRVSGVPMAEVRLQGNPVFEEYRARTSAFLPLPPRT